MCSQNVNETCAGCSDVIEIAVHFTKHKYIMFETLGGLQQDTGVVRMQVELNSLLRTTMKYRRCALEKAYQYVRGLHLSNGRLIEFYRDANDTLIARLTKKADSDDPEKTLPRIQEKIRAIGLALKNSGLDPYFLKPEYIPSILAIGKAMRDSGFHPDFNDSPDFFTKTLTPQNILELYTQGLQGL